MFLNGLLQTAGTDYSFTDATTVTFATPPSIGSVLYAIVIGTPTPPTTTPPVITTPTNILSNGDFSGGSTGWSDTPPADWDNWNKTVHQIDYNTASASVYLGKGTKLLPVGPGVDNARSGLVYVGNEWTPDLFSNWLISLEWRRIAEVETNNSPYGLGLGLPLSFNWGARTHCAPYGSGQGGWWYPVSESKALDWQSVSMVISAEPNNFLGGGTPSSYWQFSIVGGWAWVSPAVAATTYGDGFEVRNVSLSSYNS